MSNDGKESTPVHEIPRWVREHSDAFLDPDPTSMEGVIINMYHALIAYPHRYRSMNGSPLGDDGVLGRHWMTMANAFLGLLNGDTGRLDCATLEGDIRRAAREHGIKL